MIREMQKPGAAIRSARFYRVFVVVVVISFRDNLPGQKHAVGLTSLSSRQQSEIWIPNKVCVEKSSGYS